MAFAYLSVALSALQVLLTANQGYDHTNIVLEGVSLVIGSASIVGVLFAVLIMAILFGALRILKEAFARCKSADVELNFFLIESKTSANH